VGEVRHVLAATEEDIFDGVVLESRLGSGGHRFADATLIEGIYEQGVLLSLDAEGAERLPEPSANPAAVEAGPEDTVPDDLADKLRRAWDRISGRP
jgi:hypothetical protein